MRCDVAILGSGFAGSLCALILRKMGREVVVIDRARHPRFAIGESSTPTGNLALLALCDRYNLPAIRPLAKYGTWQEAYPGVAGGRKRGFSYFQHHPGHAFEPDPAHGNELLVAASPDDVQSDTQWYRADVDAFFAAQVREAGIPLLESASITSLSPGARWRIEIEHEGQQKTFDAGFVIDATGPGGAVSRALELRERSDLLHTRSRALFTHVCDLPAWSSIYHAAGGSLADHPFACDDAALHHLIEEGWMWWIRFNSGITSTGFVVDERRAPAEAGWHELLARYPALAAAFADSSLAPSPGQIISTSRLQRLVERAAGDTWALLPHAAGFIDPLHSTGIAHTLLGIERLMRLFEAAPGRLPGAGALAGYDRSVREELQHIDRIVDTCYAAMGSFRRFTAATMLYFATAITYEERRIKAGIEGDLLLMASDPALRGLVADFHRRLRSPGPLEESAIEEAIEEAIRPYNTAGLFRPPVPNMYRYTAAVI